MSHVFVSYVHEDVLNVDRLVFALRSVGVRVWLDRDSISPGARWKDAIRDAIQGGAFFIACFSKSYTARVRTYMNEELTLAIEELRLRPRNREWFVPLILDRSEIPNLPVGAGETLPDIHALRIDETWDAGISKLISLIVPCSEHLSIVSDGELLRTALKSIANEGVRPHLSSDLIRIKHTTALKDETLDELGVALLSISENDTTVSELLAWPELMRLPRSIARLTHVPEHILLKPLSEATARRPDSTRPSASGNAFAVLSYNEEIYRLYATYSLTNLDEIKAAYEVLRQDSTYPPGIAPHYLLYVLGVYARALSYRADSRPLSDLGERLLLQALTTGHGAFDDGRVLNYFSIMPATDAIVDALQRQLDGKNGKYAIVALERLGIRQEDAVLATVLDNSGSWCTYFDLVVGVVLARRRIYGPIEPLLGKYSISTERLAGLPLPDEQTVLKPIAERIVSDSKQREELFENLFYRQIDPVNHYAFRVFHGRHLSIWNG